MVAALLLLLLSTTWAAPRSMLQGFTAINRILVKSKVISGTSRIRNLHKLYGLHKSHSGEEGRVQRMDLLAALTPEEVKLSICHNFNGNHPHFHAFHYPQHQPDFFALFKHFLKGSRQQLRK